MYETKVLPLCQCKGHQFKIPVEALYNAGERQQNFSVMFFPAYVFQEVYQ
jgi:hypothetical protein